MITAAFRDLFFQNKWDKAIHPLSWLVEKFWPVQGWTEEMRAKIKAWLLPDKIDKSNETQI